jgi:hypothetical protein
MEVQFGKVSGQTSVETRERWKSGFEASTRGIRSPCASKSLRRRDSFPCPLDRPRELAGNSRRPSHNSFCGPAGIEHSCRGRPDFASRHGWPAKTSALPRHGPSFCSQGMWHSCQECQGSTRPCSAPAERACKPPSFAYSPTGRWRAEHSRSVHGESTQSPGGGGRSQQGFVSGAKQHPCRQFTDEPIMFLFTKP